jgi:SPX domain protein involved in polyphosphate accumulation
VYQKKTDDYDHGAQRSPFLASPLITRIACMNFPSSSAKQKPLVFRDTMLAQTKAESEFTEWLLVEVARIEAFYKQKENEALARFRALEEQLVIMQKMAGRNSYAEVLLSKLGQEPENSEDAKINEGNLHQFFKTPEEEGYADYERSRKYRKPINKPVDQGARKRLKHACVEYYRRLEFLRSYIAVNREAFRKITKKFDKLSGLGMSCGFMNNHIIKSYFGGMENKLDQLINGTELLVAKYVYQHHWVFLGDYGLLI